MRLKRAFSLVLMVAVLCGVLVESATAEEKMTVKELLESYPEMLKDLNRGPIQGDLLNKMSAAIVGGAMIGDWVRAAFISKYLELYFIDMYRLIEPELLNSCKAAIVQYQGSYREAIQFSGKNQEELIKAMAVVEKAYLEHPRRVLERNKGKIKR